MIKKILCLFAILLSISLVTLSPSYADGPADTDAGSVSTSGETASTDASNTSTSENALDSCRFFLGLKSWDCGTDLNPDGKINISKNLWTIVVNVLDNITVIAAYLIIGYIIYGGYLYILSGGESNKVVAGKKTIIQGITGLVIVSLANVIMNTIRFVLLQGSEHTFIDCATTECTTPTTLFTNSIQWVIGISSIVAVIFIIYGGISFITSSGDPNKIKRAKDTITYAVIGLIIVALAEAIILFVTNILNGANS